MYLYLYLCFWETLREFVTKKETQRNDERTKLSFLISLLLNKNKILRATFAKFAAKAGQTNAFTYIHTYMRMQIVSFMFILC